MATKHKYRGDYNSDGQEFPTNDDRAVWAEEALNRFRQLTNGERDIDDDLTCQIQDLITDLGHLLDMNNAEDVTADDVDFRWIVQSALANWEEER